MFKYATVKLSEIIVQALKQNQTMTDIEQTYFEARTCNEGSRRFHNHGEGVKALRIHSKHTYHPL